MSPSNMRPPRFHYWNCLQFHREGEATPVNMFSSTLPNPFLAWEGEVPAEPWCRKLGRSLALPLISDGSTWERCLNGWPRPSIFPNESFQSVE